MVAGKKREKSTRERKPQVKTSGAKARRNHFIRLSFTAKGLRNSFSPLLTSFQWFPFGSLYRSIRRRQAARPHESFMFLSFSHQFSFLCLLLKKRKVRERKHDSWPRSRSFPHIVFPFHFSRRQGKIGCVKRKERERGKNKMLGENYISLAISLSWFRQAQFSPQHLFFRLVALEQVLPEQPCDAFNLFPPKVEGNRHTNRCSGRKDLFRRQAPISFPLFTPAYVRPTVCFSLLLVGRRLA